MLLSKMLIVFLTAGLTLLSISYGYCAEKAKNRVTIAVLPCSDFMLTFKKFHPLLKYLKHKTGFEVELTVPVDYSEFERAVRSGDIDFALQDPHTYVRSASLFRRDALLRSLAWNGDRSQYGLIIARKGSGISSVKDLKGKTFMFGPLLSTAKWIAAKEIFRENGMDIDKDLRFYLHGGCCEDIAFNVYITAVDAAVVCDHFLGSHAGSRTELGIDARQIVVIGRTRSVPTRVFAARKGLNEDIVAKVTHALLDLNKSKPEDAKILYVAELGGFEKSRLEDYYGMRILQPHMVDPKRSLAR